MSNHLNSSSSGDSGMPPTVSHKPQTIDARTDLATPGGDNQVDLVTRSQVTPTPSAPHLSSTRNAIVSPPGYEITGELGRGGMGVVYSAIDLRLKRTVAIKMLLGGVDERKIVRFLIEAETIAQVNHPNVVRVFEAGELAGQPFLALELLSGGSLAAKIAHGKIPLRAAIELMLKISRGVEAAHRLGIIHRDLKPGNVMFDETGEPKVTDFGLAKHGENELTATQAMMGTPAYMAPEQAKGETKFAGPPADVHALGVMLYELTAGVRPYSGETSAAVAHQVIYDAPASPRSKDQSIPEDIEVITLKCLEKLPSHRYVDAGALADDLECWLNNEPITARPASRSERLIKWSRRKPWQATVAGLFVLSSMGASVGVVLLQGAYRQTKVANLALEKSNLELANQKSITDQANDRLKQINEDLAAQKREADTVIAIALQDLDKLTFEVSDKLKDIPKSEEIRLQILAESKKSLAALDRVRPKDQAVREYALVSYDKLANAENRMGRFRESRESLKNALRLTDSILAETPNENSMKLKKARQHSLISLLSGRLNDAKEEALHLQSAAKLIHELLTLEPNNEELLKLSTVTLVRSYTQATTNRDYKTAEESLRDYLTVYERLVRLSPKNNQSVLDLVDARILMTGFLKNRQRFDEANGMLDLATKDYKSIPASDEPNYRKASADLEWTRAGIYSEQGLNDQADQAFLGAIAKYESLVADYPKTVALQSLTAQIYWALGRHWFFANKPDKALPHLRRSSQILDQLLKDNPVDTQNQSIRESVSKLLADAKEALKK